MRRMSASMNDTPAREYAGSQMPMRYAQASNRLIVLRRADLKKVAYGEDRRRLTRSYMRIGAFPEQHARQRA